MGMGAAPSSRPNRLATLAGATALACIFVLGAIPSQAQDAASRVQPMDDLDINGFGIPDDAQMLLESDTLIYDNDRNTVTAAGGVQIDYGGNRVAADRVTYDRNTRRLIAAGNVEILDRQGNRYFATEIDITDDFADGFVNSLRVETADRTFFNATSAQRERGEITTFNEGTYTACEPCREQPEKPPSWQIRAQKVIWNGRAQTIRFEGAQFELFGMPIATLPAFEVLDPTVKRKSGFLFPGITFEDELGVGLTVPYYFALSPTYDLTVSGTGYSRQGFLAEAEWRQRFDHGQYNLQLAGIYQLNRDAFDINTVDRNEGFRGMVSSKGDFAINPRWSYGWDVMLQTDKNFARTYGIDGNDDFVRTSQVYLTGIGDRNYFDLRGYHFQVQENSLDGDLNSRDEVQPFVLPSFDYSYVSEQPIFGGELNIDLNSQALYRERLDQFNWAGDPDNSVRGIEGASSRWTAEAEWRRSFVAPGGLVVTPIAHGRSDAIFADYGGASRDEIGDFGVATDIRSAYYRAMATAGMELRWPVLFSTTSSTHVLEPIAQVFVRPDEPFGATLGIPNEDAQSLVFDATSLFDRDKFSGYDRIEGGSRANLGLRYTGDLGNGWTASGIFGQSYHLGGRNSFASPDLVYAGAYSGLETDVSDFVGQVTIASMTGLSFSAGARLDEQSLEARRIDVGTAYTSDEFSIASQYSYIQAQPLYGFNDDQQEIRVAAIAEVSEFWSVYASGTYDFNRGDVFRRAIGFAYDDDCFTFGLSLSESINRTTEDVTRRVGFQLALRTIGEVNTTTRPTF